MGEQMNEAMVARLNELQKRLTIISSELYLRADECTPSQAGHLHRACERLDLVWQDILNAMRIDGDA